MEPPFLTGFAWSLQGGGLICHLLFLLSVLFFLPLDKVPGNCGGPQILALAEEMSLSGRTQALATDKSASSYLHVRMEKKYFLTTPGTTGKGGCVGVRTCGGSG
jgi:hypothetical protein